MNQRVVSIDSQKDQIARENTQIWDVPFIYEDLCQSDESSDEENAEEEAVEAKSNLRPFDKVLSHSALNQKNKRCIQIMMSREQTGLRNKELMKKKQEQEAKQENGDDKKSVPPKKLRYSDTYFDKLEYIYEKKDGKMKQRD